MDHAAGVLNRECEPEASAVPGLYTPLDSNKREIRLLQLYSGTEPEAINTHLIPTSLDEPHVPYAAISYAWESREPQNLIHLNYSPVWIPSKQWAILRALWSRIRHGTGPVLLWMDLLCIDQCSIDDKNQQVSLMRDIFSSADVVYAWPASQAPDFGPADHLAHHMMRTDYWLRRWVVQELALARSICLFSISGKLTMDWNDFISQIFLLIESKAVKDMERFDSHRLTVSAIHKIREGMTLSQHMPRLRDVLNQFKHTRCSEVYDRIYALLSLTDLLTNKSFVVDYRKSCFRFFFEIAALFGHYEELDSFHRLDDLYSELQEFGKVFGSGQELSGHSAFASSTFNRMTPPIYYGVVVTANKLAPSSMIASCEAWIVRVEPKRISEDQRQYTSSDSNNPYETWVVQMPTPSLAGPFIRPGDICFRIAPFYHRLFFKPQYSRKLRPRSRLVASAEKWSGDAEIGAGLSTSPLHDFLTMARCDLSDDGFYENLEPRAELLKTDISKAVSRPSVKFNGAMLVESLHRWVPDPSIPEADLDVGNLRSLIPPAVLHDILVHKGFPTKPARPSSSE